MPAPARRGKDLDEAGGILVTPLLALGGEGTAVPMAGVVAGGALAAPLATVLLTRTGRDRKDLQRRLLEGDVAVRAAARGC